MSAGTAPVATLSVDLDDLWCYQRSFGVAEWERYPSFLDVAIPRMLDVLARHELKATMFAVGRDADSAERRELFCEIARGGHELGNHSYDHDLRLHQASSDAIRADIERAHQAVTESAGRPPEGFRGPGFTTSSAVLRALLALRYRYDASAFPSSIGPLARLYHRVRARGLRTTPDVDDAAYGRLAAGWASMKAHRVRCPDGELVEVPITTLPLVRTPIHGTYLHALGDRSRAAATRYFSFAMTACRLSGIAPSLLLHALDFVGADDACAIDYLPGMRRSAAAKVDLMHEVLARFARDHDVVPLADYVRDLPAATTLPVRDLSP